MTLTPYHGYVYACLQLMVNRTVPLCSQQYERMFNLTRQPGEVAGTYLICGIASDTCLYGSVVCPRLGKDNVMVRDYSAEPGW